MAKTRSAKKTSSAARAKAGSAKRSKSAGKAKKPARRKPTAAKAAAVSRPRAAAVNPLRTLAQRIVDLTIKQDDEGSFALYADNVESAEPGMPPTVGVEGLRQKFAGWRTMVSDSTWRARNVCVDGNTILIEWTGRVTFRVSGKQADMNEIAIHEVANGKIVRERYYYDRSALQP